LTFEVRHEDWLVWAGLEAPGDDSRAPLIDEALRAYSLRDPACVVLMREFLGATEHSPPTETQRLRRCTRVTGRGITQTRRRIRSIRTWVDGFAAGRLERTSPPSRP
jgi:hypothetical protein